MDVKKIGALIAEERKAKGLTQKELGKRLRVSDRAVSKWERGLNLPDAALFEPLCRELGLTVAELLRGEREPSPTVPQLEQVVSDTVALAGSKEKRASLFMGIAGLSLFVLAFVGIWLCLILSGGWILKFFWTVDDLVDPPNKVVTRPPSVQLYFYEQGYDGSYYDHHYVSLDMGGCYYQQWSDGTFEQRDLVITNPADSVVIQNLYTIDATADEWGPKRIYFRLEEGYGYNTVDVQVVRYPKNQIGSPTTLSQGWDALWGSSSHAIPWQDECFSEPMYIDLYPNEYYYAVVVTWGDGYYAEYPFLTTRMEESS